ncbi:sigma-70 family RNA polymerase sigma factor [Sphingobium sp. D43FB]|uniref:RNA polymerase sigma factor n=1 Tax=Sphingobium sp. D43FB TaxID=2017595 RepID=UPI001596A40D|nr:sigma-70 family RNA polymerase sigma factor [Sphingobium sp. D43FB]
MISVGLLRCIHVLSLRSGRIAPGYDCGVGHAMTCPTDEKCEPDGFPHQAVIERMFRIESAGMLRYFRRRGRSDADAQDLVQESFLSLAKAQVSGDPLPYLRRIARNMLINAARRETRWGKLISEAPFDEKHAAPTPPQQHLAIEARDVKQQIQRAIDQLPEKTRTIYLLHRREGLSYTQIARKMELSVKSVEYHISSALKYLVRELDQK